MSAAGLLADFEAAGITLTRNGDRLHYQTRRGVRIAPYRARILQNKPAILVELLQREIMEAAAAMGSAFDRERFKALWRQWYALQGQEPTLVAHPILHGVYVSRSPVPASAPPAGWDGTLCPGCRWPTLCVVLGPRGPHLPGGPCSAWPAETAMEVSA